MDGTGDDVLWDGSAEDGTGDDVLWDGSAEDGDVRNECVEDEGTDCADGDCDTD